MRWWRHWPWLLLVPMAVGFARLRFDTDVLNLMPPGEPAVEGVKLFQQNFAQARELVITLSAPEADLAEAAARSLTSRLRMAQDKVAEVAWQPPWLEQPGQMGELMAYLWLNQPPEAFRQLAERLSPANVASTVAEVREQMATSISPSGAGAFGYDPFGFLALPGSEGLSFSSQGSEMFASPDGTFRLLFVKPAHGFDNYRECSAWVEAIKGLVEQWRQTDEGAGVTVRFTGGPAIEAEIATGMAGDMNGSIGMTALIIAILFWLSHRRLVPMIWLLFLLAVILAATLSLGGLLFGSINVVSLGFAGILLGLAVDYGVVHYQEAVASPNATIPQIRRAIGPSIFWAAATTISAFLVLNVSGLPGLAQLGSLVALGVALSAVVMLYAFLPPLFRDRAAKGAVPADEEAPAAAPRRPMPAAALGVTGALLLASAALLCRGVPEMDQSSRPLRPRHSAAYAALDEINTRLAKDRPPLWLMSTSSDIATIVSRMEQAEPLLRNSVEKGQITSFALPTQLLPRPEHQAANRETAAQMVKWRDSLKAAAFAAGFNEEACAMAGRILDAWQTALTSPGVFWPSSPASRWIMEKVIARKGDQFIAMGMITPKAGETSSGALQPWAEDVRSAGFVICGWELLGSAVLEHVRHRIVWVVVPMMALVLGSLLLAFGRIREILLSLAVLALSGLTLLAVMRAAGWSWNLLNLMALPLMLGTGVDYSIFMQLALRRHHGDTAEAHASVGRALLLCGGTAMAGFGSLAWSSNAGIASLGAVCAVGIGLNMLISVGLLPAWWSVAAHRSAR